MEYPIDTWKYMSNNEILICVNNTPMLNTLASLNNDKLFVKFNSTDSDYDKLKSNRLSTYVGMDADKRYFILPDELGIPSKNGVIVITSSEEGKSIVEKDDNDTIKKDDNKENPDPITIDKEKMKNKKLGYKLSLLLFGLMILVLLLLIFFRK